MSDKSKPGDRTLMCYVGNGAIIASTYSYSFVDEEGVNDIKH